MPGGGLDGTHYADVFGALALLIRSRFANSVGPIPSARRLRALGSCGWSTSFVFPFGLSLGNAFALALKHQLALELGDGSKHVEHQSVQFEVSIACSSTLRATAFSSSRSPMVTR